MSDFIPTNAAAFSKFAMNVAIVVNKNLTKWEHIPTHVYDELATSISDFDG